MTRSRGRPAAASVAAPPAPPGDPDAALRAMRVLVARLADAGMTDACLSPGSRSTPLALALSREPRVRLHVHLDERSSAFFALGLARATGRPVAVACTSGTAVAEMLPAIVEADASRIPLVALTADRPEELRGTGANQTIRQPGIFGGFVRLGVDAPVPVAGDDGAWRGVADTLVAAALGWPPGPVHGNLPVREPLIPSGGALAEPPPAASAVPGGGSAVGGSGDAGEGLHAPDDADLARLREMLQVERGVILAGTSREPAPSILGLADALAWPLIAEPTSGLRVPGALTAGQWLLGDERFMGAHTPEVVLQFGAAPLSRAGLSLVGGGPRLAIVDPDGVVADPTRSATHRVVADAEVMARALSPDRRRGDTAWNGAWRAADAAARHALDSSLDTEDRPSEQRIARDVAASMLDGEVLVVGASMPVRDLDACMAPRRGLRVLSNRGASGIDGVVSTAFGVAASGVGVTALIGDLTLLHDVGGLLWNARRGAPVTFVVPDNGGGGIFPLLGQRALAPGDLERLFVTPHDLDLAAVAAAAGVPHLRVERAADLAPAIAGAREHGVTALVQVVVDRRADAQRRAAIVSEVARGVEAAWSPPPTPPQTRP